MLHCLSVTVIGDEAILSGPTGSGTIDVAMVRSILVP
jgi:hypothetical protein